MQVNQFGKVVRTLGVVAMLASCPVSSKAYDSPGVDGPLVALIDAAAYRISLADQVALTKWDSGKAIEDLPREKIVIDNAVRQAALRGLSTERTADVFADQIEANKLVQYGLLAQWERAGKAPIDPRPDLARDIRPKLDALQDKLIEGLDRTRDLDTRSGCAKVVAAAVGAYVSNKRLDALHALALDRATARICER
jgi:chorismate mutase